MFSLICVWINGWVNNGEACNLRGYRAHYDVIVMGRFDVSEVSVNELGKYVKRLLATVTASLTAPVFYLAVN